MGTYAQVDVTVQNERGGRTRIPCESMEDFRVRCYNHCDSVWQSKSRGLRNALLKDLQEVLGSFNLQNRCHFSIGGLTIAPSRSFADQNKDSRVYTDAA